MHKLDRNTENFDKGYEAFKQGKAKSNNPYKNLSSRFEMDLIFWNMGWDEAHKVSNRKQT